MQHIQKKTLTIADANKTHNVELDSAMWAFIVKSINYRELTFDAKTKLIHIDGYVPFEGLAKEWINGIANGSFDVCKCELCNEFFDLNKEAGIFGRPDDLDEFICMSCAENMTARNYYERFIERNI